ncbi:MAG: hypothetical protein KJT03_24145, partial [Verrucomicrobiae bacterium]|nr:hypothetical protein [Verrucomicrobiae bacterium]
VISGLNNRKVSTSFAISRQREVHFGISLIRSKDWLGDLNEENLKRYVTSLQIQYPNRFKLQNPDTAFAPLPNTEYLLGNPYKLVHYEVISEQDPEQVTDVKDFIAQEGDLLIVLSFECPKPLAARYIRTPDLLLSGICRAENLD